MNKLSKEIISTMRETMIDLYSTGLANKGAIDKFDALCQSTPVSKATLAKPPRTRVRRTVADSTKHPATA